MKFAHSLILILLIAFTFLGNVGVKVFTHSCKEDGVFTSFFVESADHCDEIVISTVPPCCQKTEKKEKDCCHDEVDVFKVNFDFFSSYELNVQTLFISGWKNPFTFYVEPEIVYTSDIVHFVHPPPKPSGIELLIKNQVFRI